LSQSSKAYVANHGQTFPNFLQQAPPIKLHIFSNRDYKQYSIETSPEKVEGDATCKETDGEHEAEAGEKKHVPHTYSY